VKREEYCESSSSSTMLFVAGSNCVSLGKRGTPPESTKALNPDDALVTDWYCSFFLSFVYDCSLVC
jgi:hypothetical protein